MIAEMDATAGLAAFEKARSATGAIFQLMAAWSCVGEMLGTDVGLVNAVELHLSSVIRYLETSSGISATEIGRPWLGPAWEKIPDYEAIGSA
jgi:hypothetical protein